MRFSLKTTMLIVTLACVACGLIENINRHWIFLGEMTGNYTRIETHAYWIGFQGAIAGASLVVACLILSRVIRQSPGAVSPKIADNFRLPDSIAPLANSRAASSS